MRSTILDCDTIAELDEALLHLSLVPTDARGDGWSAYMNALLEKRKRLEKTNERRSRNQDDQGAAR
jgi:hypothetical protein